MPDITDPEAISFCNTFVRTSADKLATLFYECRYLDELRVADGNIATTISLRESHIRRVADLMLSTIQSIRTIENRWFNVGTGDTMNNKINNTGAHNIIDGSPADGRPAITGSDVHNVMSRIIDLKKWVDDAEFGGTGLGVSRDAMFNTMVVVATAGNKPMQEGQATTFIANRCGEIVAEYEAAGNAKLTQILAVAVNPRVPK